MRLGLELKIELEGDHPQIDEIEDSCLSLSTAMNGAALEMSDDLMAEFAWHLKGLRQLVERAGRCQGHDGA